ncbi:hypothetical protein BC832DRAFT_558119 [Gaertneriomyces semiglobifer]|nr:hypothetical protein BC832DRAFT_558119 [Gaertneriomyces semiglobifer]
MTTEPPFNIQSGRLKMYEGESAATLSGELRRERSPNNSAWRRIKLKLFPNHKKSAQPYPESHQNWNEQPHRRPSGAFDRAILVEPRALEPGANSGVARLAEAAESEQYRRASQLSHLGLPLDSPSQRRGSQLSQQREAENDRPSTKEQQLASEKRLWQERESWAREREGLLEDISTLRRANADLNDCLKQEKEGHDDAYHALEERNAQLESELRDLHSALIAKNGEITNLHQSLRESRQSIEMQEDQIAALHRSIGQANVELDRCRSSMHRLQTSMAERDMLAAEAALRLKECNVRQRAATLYQNSTSNPALIGRTHIIPAALDNSAHRVRSLTSMGSMGSIPPMGKQVSQLMGELYSF